MVDFDEMLVPSCTGEAMLPSADGYGENAHRRQLDYIQQFIENMQSRHEVVYLSCESPLQRQVESFGAELVETQGKLKD